MYKVNNKQLPDSSQGLSQLRDGKNHSGGTCIFKNSLCQQTLQYKYKLKIADVRVVQQEELSQCFCSQRQ